MQARIVLEWLGYADESDYPNVMLRLWYIKTLPHRETSDSFQPAYSDLLEILKESTV